MKGLALKHVESKTSVISIKRSQPTFDQHQMVMEFREKARKMARSILRRWRAHIEINELDSVVDLALCEAVSRFEPERGVSFITYMFYYLKGHLIKTVTSLANNKTVSDDKDEGFLIEDLLSTEASEQVLADEKMYINQMLLLSKDIYGSLDRLERTILQRLFVNDEQLIDVAADLGYSRCHVSRIKKKAIETLQTKLSKLTGEKYGETEVKSFGNKSKQITRRRPKAIVFKKAS